MGNWIFKEPERRVIIQGLDASGKTSLLYRLKLGEVVQTIPTVGFNVETVETANGASIMCWDLGGRDKVRPLYRHYYPNTHGYVYVVDSHDTERLNQALDELVQYILLEDMTRNTVVMVLANKQDLPGAVSALEIEEALKGMYNFEVRTPGRGHTVFIRPCSIVTKEGVDEAFHDFTKELRLKHAGKSKCGLLSLDSEIKDAENGAKEATKSDEAAEKGCKDLGTSSGKDTELTAHKGAKTLSKNPLAILKSFFY